MQSPATLRELFPPSWPPGSAGHNGCKLSKSYPPCYGPRDTGFPFQPCLKLLRQRKVPFPRVRLSYHICAKWPKVSSLQISTPELTRICAFMTFSFSSFCVLARKYLHVPSGSRIAFVRCSYFFLAFFCVFVIWHSSSSNAL